MDIRDLLVDGIEQLNDWLAGALEDMSDDELNWLPEGKAVSAGFDAWHIVRTQDNIVNFVLRGAPPLWMAQGYLERSGGLPKAAQGTGMPLEEARNIRISGGLLREYAAAVGKDTVAFLREFPQEQFEEVQLIKPLGEMPKWRIFRQVLMTHGFMHLGEINLIRGMQGKPFMI
jgi:hypothetical protein